MDTSFIRNQMIAKLREFEFYNGLYQSAIQVEKGKLAALHTKEELDEYAEVTEALKDFNTTTNEIIQDIDIIVARLCVSHKQAMERLKNVVKERKEESTSQTEDISITREDLKYSSFAKSAGYDKEHNLMDIEFTNGNVYRYETVPHEFFEKIVRINSLKGINAELKMFPSKKIHPVA